MEKLPMCRICQAENVRINVVVNKNLHELYERLTDIPFVTDDSRPHLACSFCCAKLKQCFRLLRKCLEAEELFAQIMSENYEPKPLINQEVSHGLIISPIVNISIVEVGQTESIAVKEELPAVFERQDNIPEPDEEYQCDDLELENLDEKYILPHDCDADYKEDDVPLMEFKIEEEEQQQASKEKRRPVDTKKPTVAQEPNLHFRRTKLEDSVPDDQQANQISDSKVIENTQNRTTKLFTKCKKLHECHTCQRSFSQKAHLSDHVITHTGEKPYQCNICLSSFSRKVTLSKHIRTHTGERPFKCEICQSSFSQKTHLTDHVRTHTGEKPYKCEICQHSFNQKAHLTDHIRTHTGVKPYKCDTCQRSFSQKPHLTDHIRTHTGEKPYMCNICPSSFSRKITLRKHIRTHTGEKPYKCVICQSNFSQKINLTNHIRSHTGEKPYKCDICQSSFRRKTHLTDHIRTHTGEKPFKCVICHCKFRTKSNFTVHVRANSCKPSNSGMSE